MVVVWRVDGPLIDESERITKALRPFLKKGFRRKPKEIWRLFHLGSRIACNFPKTPDREAQLFMPLIAALEEFRNVREMEELLNGESPRATLVLKLLPRINNQRDMTLVEKAMKVLSNYRKLGMEGVVFKGVESSLELIKDLQILLDRGKYREEIKVPNVLFAGNLRRILELHRVNAVITDDRMDLIELNRWNNRTLPLIVIVKNGKGLLNDLKDQLKIYPGKYVIVNNPYEAASYVKNAI